MILRRDSESWEGGEVLDEDEAVSSASEPSDARGFPPIILADAGSRMLSPQAPGGPTDDVSWSSTVKPTKDVLLILRSLQSSSDEYMPFLAGKLEEEESSDVAVTTLESSSEPIQAAKPLPPPTPRERAKALIALQSFEGSFQLTETFASIVAIPLADLEAKLAEMAIVTLPDNDKKKLWATLLAVSAFEIQLKSEKEMWELVVEKARDWISGIEHIAKVDLDKLEALTKEVLGA